MWRSFAAVRPDERRDTWSAFATLFCFIGSHTVLETARDALFLSKIPASQLPWVYLAIAAVSLAVAQGQAKLSRRIQGKRALTVWTATAALITGGFWAGLGSLGSAGLYALYVWSGVLTTLVLVHFWTMLGDLFSVTQAKRTYGVIGAGSVLGAIAGSGLASVLTRILDPRHLILTAATGFVIAALVSLSFRSSSGAAQLGTEGADEDTSSRGLLSSAQFVGRHPYARRVATMLFLAAATLTLADFVFKRAVADAVPAAELGATFASIYFALNLLSLLVQLFVVAFVIRRLGLIPSLAILPALLAVGGLGIIVIAGLPAALLIKGADGGLRYTLHRTSTELLFVPLTELARRRVKAFIDVVGQRGGQGLASVGILVATALVAPPWVVALVLVGLAALWLATAARLHQHYLELFRGQLREGQLEQVGEFPELDVGSLETVIAALDSEKDDEVLAALGVLKREGKVHLVPALILYHPSDEVVERALSLFSRARRKNAVHIVDRLVESGSPRIRAAAVAARTAIAPDARKLQMRLSFEESPEVRATIVVNLITMGEIVGQEARERLDELIHHGSTETRIALAQAIARPESTEHADVLIRLSRAVELEVREAAARAMGHVQHPDCLPSLVDLLGVEDTRPTAARALLRFEQTGLDALDRALEDHELPGRIRWHIPALVAKFDAERAAPVLLRHLPREQVGMVRYRIIRALQRVVSRDPNVRLDLAPIEQAIDETIARAYRFVNRRVALRRGASEDESRKTPSHELLCRLLRDKEANAVARLLRLLGLVHPGEDFDSIARGLAGDNKEAKASSLELLENVLTGARRRAILGLLDDVSDAQRLASAAGFHEAIDFGYEDALADMLKSRSEAVADIAVYHVGELGLRSLRAVVAELEPRPDVELALERLANPSVSEHTEMAVAH